MPKLQVRVREYCYRCEGSGKIDYYGLCNTCKGSGYIKSWVSLEELKERSGETANN